MSSIDSESFKAVALRLYLLAHPHSETATALADSLMRHFMDPPASGGLRLPVFLTPDHEDGLPPSWDADGIQLDDADHTLVVVLSDSRMVQEVDGGTGRQWSEFLEHGSQLGNDSNGRHSVFGISIGKEGYLISDKRHMVGVSAAPNTSITPSSESSTDEAKAFDDWLKRASDIAALHIAIRAIPLLQPKAIAGPNRRPPITLFLSHAKADLGPANADEADPVRSVELAVRELPIQYWFDAQNIPPAEIFEHEIHKGLQDCSIVVVFLGDQYASRPFCQLEVLAAKRLELPILVVDALENGERRNFPYLGNVPTLTWAKRSRKDDAMRIVFSAIRETLRFLHNRSCLSLSWLPVANMSPDNVVLATHPEAITLGRYPNSSSAQQTFVYPDPPLTLNELGVLKSLRDAEFVTPMIRLATSKLPSNVNGIAVSISASQNLRTKGLSSFHERTLTDEIHLALLLAGVQIHYGGALEAPSITTETNFTARLFDLVQGYSRLASDAGAHIAPVINSPPWPVWMEYDASVLKLFGRLAELRKGPRPPPDEIPEEENGVTLFPSRTKLGDLPDTPSRRLAWTRGLTLMRRRLTLETQSRLLLGGAISGYRGLCSGILEEAWLSIAMRRPLFLSGFLGGATEFVINQLQYHQQMNNRITNLGYEDPAIDEVLQLATSRNILVARPDSQVQDFSLSIAIHHPMRMVEEIRRVGKAGLTNALNNGLTDDQNRELFVCRNPMRIVELILLGLSRLSAPSN